MRWRGIGGLKGYHLSNWTGTGWPTDEAQLGELQDHPVLRGLLEGKVPHSAQVVGLGYNVVLQLHREEQ